MRGYYFVAVCDLSEVNSWLASFHIYETALLPSFASAIKNLVSSVSMIAFNIAITCFLSVSYEFKPSRIVLIFAFTLSLVIPSSNLEYKKLNPFVRSEAEPRV
jgi:hypothetical protein